MEGKTNPVETPTVGVIGGSGLYEMEGLENIREVTLTTPFGEPSDGFIVGELAGLTMVFLPRHGRGHRLTPSEINYRANIYGMKSLGVTHLVSVSAVGSMKEEIHPGDVVVVDQFIDRTYRRETSFFGGGVVVHVSMADPVCPILADCLHDAALSLGIPVHRGGTYVCIEGPQFSTRGESLVYRSWGVDVIGMTNMPEARLAREAEISYATLALATDYDCWHETEEAVSVEAVVNTLRENVSRAKQIIAKAVLEIPGSRRGSPAWHALENAIITDPSHIPPEARDTFSLLLGRYFEGHED